MKKIGNLFELAEQQLIKEKKTGKIPCYTLMDVIEYAIIIRKWLDMNPKNISKAMRLTKDEIIRKKKLHRQIYYLKTGK